MYKQYLSVEDALLTILANSSPLAVETVSLTDSIGRVLAEDLRADVPIPCFAKSPLDGYAVRFADVQAASPDQPVILTVNSEVISAGLVPSQLVGPGQAARIMTGAMLPEGADTIIKFEDTNLELTEANHYQTNGDHIEIRQVPKKAGNYALIGEDMEEGDLVVAAGKPIDAAVVAVLATFGKEEVQVYKRPTAILLASGSELVEVKEKPGQAKIRNSNGPSLTAQLTVWGAHAVRGDILADEKEEIKKALLEALDKYDIVITTGGVSVGDYDIMKDVFQEIGAEILFWRVAMRPGTPMVVAKYKDKMLFGLSGNPSASYISCELFVRSYIKKMLGHTEVWRDYVRAQLTNEVGRVVNQDRYLRAVAAIDSQGRLLVTNLPKQKSGIISNLVDANCLVYIPAQSQAINAGDMVDIVLLKAPGVYKQ